MTLLTTILENGSYSSISMGASAIHEAMVNGYYVVLKEVDEANSTVYIKYPIYYDSSNSIMSFTQPNGANTVMFDDDGEVYLDGGLN